jgi:hypothetical protein
MTTHPISKILLTAGLLSFAICAAATAAMPLALKEHRAGLKQKAPIVQIQLADADSLLRRHEMKLVVCFPAGMGVSAYVPGRLDIPAGNFGLCSADLSR